jgi:hypothetical protein
LSSAAQLIGEDPYVMSENDPSKCRAAESSLWEINTLTTHYCSIVVRMAKVSLPSVLFCSVSSSFFSLLENYDYQPIIYIV